MTQDSQRKTLSAKKFCELLIRNDVSYFCGVPDTSLSSFGFYLDKNSSASHDIAANEGNAVASAIGYYISTGKVPLVYMQNSGLGNAINPLMSLADGSVMGIPMILLIGWRGEPGKQDEPQHQKQGGATQELINSLGIPHDILSEDEEKASAQVKHMIKNTNEISSPCALIVRNGTFETHDSTNKKSPYLLSREDAIGLIADSAEDSAVIVATAGKASRELFEYRNKMKQGHGRDLLIVGGMGHASGIAMNIAAQESDRKVYCVDGDGALIMHMGVLPIIASKGLGNFCHLVLNNGSHQSVGGQPTVAFDIDIPKIAKASGYDEVFLAEDIDSLKSILRKVRESEGTVLVEIRINMESRDNLSRPDILPDQNKKAFMDFLHKA